MCCKRREAYIDACTVANPRAKCTCIYTSTYIHTSITQFPPDLSKAFPSYTYTPHIQHTIRYSHRMYTYCISPHLHHVPRRTNPTVAQAGRPYPITCAHPVRRGTVWLLVIRWRGFRGRAGYGMGWDGRYSHTYTHTYIHVTTKGSHASDVHTYLNLSLCTDISPYGARARSPVLPARLAWSCGRRLLA